MSKSIPDSSIFMTDTYEDIKRKINNAWCPEGISKENPILEYYKYLVFEKDDIVEIKRKKEHGGNLDFSSYNDLQEIYENKGLHPLDLKNTLIDYLDKYLQPIRDYFDNNKSAKELKDTVEKFEVTR